MIGAILGFFTVFYDFQIDHFGFTLNSGTTLFGTSFQNLTDELAFTLLLPGLLLIAYSREKIEDERVQQIRLEAFQWSILAHFAILLVADWCCYNGLFFYVLVFNLFTLLIVFLLRFYYVLLIADRRNADKIPDAA
jgi:hypothetical protein